MIGGGKDPGLSARRRMRRPYTDRYGLCTSHTTLCMAVAKSPNAGVGATGGRPVGGSLVYGVVNHACGAIKATPTRRPPGAPTREIADFERAILPSAWLWQSPTLFA